MVWKGGTCGSPLWETLVPAKTTKKLKQSSKRVPKPNSTKTRKQLQIELTISTTSEIEKQHYIFPMKLRPHRYFRQTTRCLLE